MADPLDRRRRLTERLGINPAPKLRMDEISDQLRMSVWNTLYTTFERSLSAMGPRTPAIVHALRWDVAYFGRNAGRLIDRLKREFLAAAQSWTFYETLDIVVRGLEGLPTFSGDSYWRMWNDVLDAQPSGS